MAKATDWNMAGILEKIKANTAKINACERHEFDPATFGGMGKKMTCLHCGGEMNLRDIGDYIKGYEAACRAVMHGRITGADDIWPGWRKDGALREPKP